MRAADKNRLVTEGSSQIFGTDFHEFIQRENEASSLELASEFGLTLSDVKLLKKKMGRS